VRRSIHIRFESPTAQPSTGDTVRRNPALYENDDVKLKASKDIASKVVLPKGFDSSISEKDMKIVEEKIK
jgi:hypothetical protein